MVILIFLSISLVGVLGIRHKFISEDLAPYLIFFIYAASLFPSIGIPYIIDDIDHLHTLSVAMESAKVREWIFTPHNEHVIPTLKYLYYFCYKHFWVNPQLFHSVIIIIATGIIILTYHLIRKLTRSIHTAFIAAVLLASSNLSDLAIFVITNSHIVFCLFFLILLFYAQHQYLATKKTSWALVIILSTALAPTTFALGLTSIGLAFLFEYLCIPQKLKQTKNHRNSTLLLVFIGWSIGLALYLNAIGDIIYAKHYQDLPDMDRPSALAAANILESLKYLKFYLTYELIPLLFPNIYISMGIFFFCAFGTMKYYKQIEWKKILFLLALGIPITMIIFTFRIAWGTTMLSFSRYDVFPAFMMCGIYVFIWNIILKNNKNIITNRKLHTFLYSICFLLVTYSGILRYNRADHVNYDTNAIAQAFNFKFRQVFTDYFHDNPFITQLNVRNTTVRVSGVNSLATKKMFVPGLWRYPRKLAFHAQYLLPIEIKERIHWKDETDEHFMDYVKQRNVYGRYDDLIDFFKPANLP